MPIAVYRKAPPVEVRPRRQLPMIPVIFMVLGSLVIGSVAGPVASYFLFVSPSLGKNNSLISPLPKSSPVVLSSQVKAAAAAPKVFDELDYTNPANWFPNAGYPKISNSKITHYNLSIPKLGIKDAIVEIGGNDLEKSLIHYPGTANPGELGAPVVFGHSILRQFYNPKNYKSIFSTIMTLKNGDDIEIYYDGVKYLYRVVNKIEVKPEDVQILEQQFNGKYLKLVTCVPEGTYLRRGVVIAELIN